MTVKQAFLGADYSGSQIYLGLIEDDKVIATASLDMTQPKAGINRLRDLLTIYRHDIVNKIWVEESWINGTRFPRSGIMLARIAAFIEIAAYDTGLDIEFVHPLTWRKAIYGKAKPANPKEVARAYVKEMFGFETQYKKDHNLCEAILLAHYGNLQSKN